VWYNKDGIANILSLARVEEKDCITYDSHAGKQFVIHKEDRRKKYFKKAKNGLYYLDVTETDESLGTVLVNTVEDNKFKYTNRAYKQATLARKLQNVIGRP
jgi:hypothetical protein